MALSVLSPVCSLADRAFLYAVIYDYCGTFVARNVRIFNPY